eukprot:CAMPEP_0113316594 /NCGR_PEP_ID=MMETSP0010_2-20120614/11815_1 /TAXON_ID=216773 ORGANISM="Corethron hystrix, Strain 308" /NCGR_SAMPLE_ID=MMETSP0010_2 /ASSEMBLY_ACC=CAM_ASM_000155 /LENGTH=1282 /DNA_ID=CAMNT_0000173357 /DNA_START=1 /DNA_END=3846 /DNA_ORIENTATION=+ /assembly_acc=CAM_ASM_000155
MEDAFLLTEGRPGRETGLFDILAEEDMDMDGTGPAGHALEETTEQMTSRRLLEELQRTFVSLEGTQKRHFDPRGLVETSNCLNLEFDVWQQNDASEYTMKLFDRLEIVLKKWAPRHFDFFSHTFGLRQTKQKICKKCGLRTNREEDLMSIDCEIRNCSDIHDSLAAFCKTETMEGDEKVECDRCKIKCDTVLRTAISALPNVLILSLKRFDIDYQTFETMKLNNRCAFEETLNMKKYSLKGMEAMEAMEKGTHQAEEEDGDTCMDIDPLDALPDEDYQYNLVGVLVHAGVAQGGHYFSVIKDRSSQEDDTTTEAENIWYRFDDDDVTSFDPAQIESQCFGGKIMKETKYPNGQVSLVETDQLANALMLFYEKVKPTTAEAKKEDAVAKETPQEKDTAPRLQNVEVSTGYQSFRHQVSWANLTHSLQSFLIEQEFQIFMKELLRVSYSPADSNDDNSNTEMINLSPSSPKAPSSPSAIYDWQLHIWKVSIHYVFDILFHSPQREREKSLMEWTSMIIYLFDISPNFCRWFITELANKTIDPNSGSNWFQIFCLECTDPASRKAAISIFGAAFTLCAQNATEQAALLDWVRAWTQQGNASPVFQTEPSGIYPVKLSKRIMGSAFENGEREAAKISYSALGVLISELGYLLEVSPKYWRSLSDFCLLIRNISAIGNDVGGDVIKEALIVCQIPGRLICLALKENSPRTLKEAFPGSSMPVDVFESSSIGFTSPHSMVLSNTNATVVGPHSGVANATSSLRTQTIDYDYLFEALGHLLNVKGAKKVPLLEESIESPPECVIFTQEARNALATIFDETADCTKGMAMHDIQAYMKKIDMNSVTSFQVKSILTKYDTFVNNDGLRCLSLDGFLDYYLDNAQKNELQVRSVLHTFGYRLDMTRRPLSVRARNDTELHPFESIGCDVALRPNSYEPTDLGPFAEAGFLSTGLYLLGFGISESLTAYILASFFFNRVSVRTPAHQFLFETLTILSRAPTNWAAGKETTRACLLIFQTLASLPESDHQLDRINTILCGPNVDDAQIEGLGLLPAASLKSKRTHYSRDFQSQSALDRYIDLIKHLSKITAVNSWMSDHEELWSMLKQHLQPHAPVADQGGNELLGENTLGERDDALPAQNANRHLQEDIQPINDSDDDSNYRNGKVRVDGAKKEISINGIYVWNGTYDGVGKFTKNGVWGGQNVVYTMYRCQLTDQSRRWFISIVPANSSPGTNKDTDFYSVLFFDNDSHNHAIPPVKGWRLISNESKDMEADHPTCTWISGDDDELEDGHLW